MAERVGIPAARDGRGRTYGRAAIDAVPPPFEAYKPLRCGGCTTAVIAVPSYPRRTPRGGTTQVMAFYRLTGHGEHDPGCDYDFKNRAEHLIRDSRGTLVKDGEDYELRLPDPDTIEPPDPLPPSKPGEPTARLSVTASNRTLVPALSTAAGILRLLREFDDDPDAARRFRARYAGKKLRWNQFCRHATEAAAIAAHLERPPKARHPLAVHGTVRDIGTAHSGNTHQLRDEHEDYLDHAGERRRLPSSYGRRTPTPSPPCAPAIDGSDTGTGSSGSPRVPPSPKYSCGSTAPGHLPPGVKAVLPSPTRPICRPDTRDNDTRRR